MTLDDRRQLLEALDRARFAFAAGLTDDALRHVLLAVRLDPSHVEARLLEAEIHLLRGEHDAAEYALDAVLQHDPAAARRLDVMLLRVRWLIGRGDRDEARRMLTVLCDEKTDDERPHRLLAALALGEGDDKEAAEPLRRVARTSFGDMTVERLLARAAATDTVATVATSPDRKGGAGAGVGCSTAPLRSGLVADVTHWTLNGLSLTHRPDDAPIDVAAHRDDQAALDLDRARALMRAGRGCDADVVFADLLRCVSDDASLWLEAAALAVRLDRLRVAEQRYGRALELSRGGEGIDAMLGLSQLAMRRGDWREAGRWAFGAARSALASDEQRATGWARLTVCALAAQRHGLAERAAARLRQWANAETRRRLLADAWMTAAGPAAVEQATDFDAASHEDSPLSRLLDDAAGQLRASIADGQPWADTHYHLAVCEAARGRSALARRAVQAALDRNPHYRAAIALAARLPRETAA